MTIKRLKIDDEHDEVQLFTTDGKETWMIGAGACYTHEQTEDVKKRIIDRWLLK